SCTLRFPFFLSRRFEDGTDYEGEWEGGMFHGHGKIIWGKGVQDTPNGCVYEGEFRKGERHGQGKCVFPGGEQYEGGWENNKMHGEGTLKLQNRGYKMFVFPDGRGVYDGHWRGCKRHGQGTFTFSNGDVYEG
ncbi:unnamed protein product, partial [Discosporangium mesarthrocarpum]